MSDTAPAHQLVSFGVFEIDLRSGELRKSGARLNLQQQPLQLLSVLLEQPGELVTREELRKRLWPDDTVSSRGAIGPVITADGSRVAYVDAESHWAIFAVPSSGGEPETVCGGCGDGFVYVQDWSRDETRLLYLAASPTEVFVLDLRSDDKRRALQRSPQGLWQARFSPDERWISVLEALDAEGRTKLWVVPFRDGSAPKADEWVGVTRGEHWDDKPRWSPDGNLMYFTSLRDGFHCLWAQRLRPDTKAPIGPAFSVQRPSSGPTLAASAYTEVRRCRDSVIPVGARGAQANRGTLANPPNNVDRRQPWTRPDATVATVARHLPLAARAVVDPSQVPVVATGACLLRSLQR